MKLKKSNLCRRKEGEMLEPFTTLPPSLQALLLIELDTPFVLLGLFEGCIFLGGMGGGGSLRVRDGETQGDEVKGVVDFLREAAKLTRLLFANH